MDAAVGQVFRGVINSNKLRKIVIANEVKQSPSLGFIMLFGRLLRRASS